MTKSAGEPWFGALGGECDTFPDFESVVSSEAARALQAHFHAIREEILVVLDEHPSRLRPYFNDSLTSRRGRWDTYSLVFWDLHHRKNRRFCPRTTAVIDGIPNLVSASVSRLSPGTSILPHRGDTDAIVRMHLPLVVPARLPECGLKVGSTTCAWVEGEVLGFTDASRHSAWNRTAAARYVLIVDVIKPQYSGRRRSICATVLASLAVQRVASLVLTNGRLPGSVRRRLTLVLRPVAHAGLALSSGLRRLREQLSCRRAPR